LIDLPDRRISQHEPGRSGRNDGAARFFLTSEMVAA
jgi:hypothetical protein